MIRLNISQEMIDFIKNSRDKYSMKASDLAQKIGKSNAYISKLEKGDYKTISYEELCEMLEHIVGENKGQKQVDDFLTGYVLNVKITEENIEQDYGLITYDNVIRQIEIPSDLIDYINQEIKENKLIVSDIIKRANENPDLSPYTKDSKYEYNTYYPSEGDDDSFVKFYLDEKSINGILKKDISTTNYLTMLALLYTIYRLKNTSESLSEATASSVLSRYHFYNLQGMKLTKYAEDRKNLASEKMKNIPSSFVSILSGFMILVSKFFNSNPEYTTSKILRFHENLSKDPSFVMAMLDLPISKVKDLDVEDKRELLKEINQLITKYGEKKNKDEYKYI